MKATLATRIRSGGYDGYAYAYPHKTAYRPLVPSVPLSEAWKDENKRNLFLYVHLPFCEMRCGFCNLFTTTRPGEDLVSRTLRATLDQSRIVADSIDPERIVQAGFGGGTPSFLSVPQLETLFKELKEVWPANWKQIPLSFEVSPGTVTPEKLNLLKSVGIDRISLGVQSFIREDLILLKRPQPLDELDRACGLIASAEFPVFNIDLIYGNEGQDVDRWLRSVSAALAWNPEELYLYPLYVGRLTNLNRSGKRPAEHRRELYLAARDLLRAFGYRQISMRLFRRGDVTRETDYCCQDDGMVGLGPGARSYTLSLHYSSEYAVGQTGILDIIERFNSRTDSERTVADYGSFLDIPEQKRRFMIKSLLRADGVSHAAYQNRFGSTIAEDFSALNELLELGLAVNSTSSFRLTDNGLSWSDTIGPWLYSEDVTNRMGSYELA